MSPITVYTKENCQPCRMTIKKLEQLGLPYVTLPAEQNLEYIAKLGHTSAPVVTVGADSWSGFQPDRLMLLAA